MRRGTSRGPAHLFRTGLTSKLDQFAQGLVLWSFDCLQAQRSHNLSGQPVPLPGYSRCEKTFFPVIRPEFPLQQVVAVGSHPLTAHLQERSGSVSSVTAHYQTEDSNYISTPAQPSPVSSASLHICGRKSGVLPVFTQIVKTR